MFLSSPGDVKDERNIVIEAIRELNNVFRESLGVEIVVCAWEDVPGGFNVSGAQGVLDESFLPENCDIVVGLLWARMGTPLGGYSSGTEYELKRAINKWKKEGYPRVMVYFSKRDLPFNVDRTQLALVDVLRKELESLGLIHKYTSSEEFRNRWTTHLTQFIQANFSPISPPDVLELKSYPIQAGVVERRTLLEDIMHKNLSTPMLLVEGISGSGKSTLVRSYLHSALHSYSKDFVYWFKANENDSLERLLLGVSKDLKLTDESPIRRLTTFLNYLAANKGVLIIDDYEKVDTDVAKELVKAALNQHAPSVVIVISTKDKEIDLRYDLSVLKISGYRRNELEELLKINGIRVDETIVSELIQKTQGIPVVVKLFINCVNEAGFNPRDLLKDVLFQRQDYKNWYSNIEAQLTPEENKLLSYLSLCDDLFDFQILKRIAERLRIANFQQSFEGLQRSFLIENYKMSNWRVHPFITRMASEKLKDNERTKIYSMIADQYQQRVKNKRFHQLTNNEILYLIKACRYYKKAELFQFAYPIIDNIRKLLKRRGDFGILYELTAPVDDELVRDWWLDYHYVHSCMVIGKFSEVRKVIADLHKSTTKGQESLLISKIFAELENTYNAPQSALKIIDNVINDRIWAEVRRPNIKDIVLLYKVNTLIRLDRIQEAQKLSKDIYFRNEKFRNYSAAISNILIAISHLKKNNYEAARTPAVNGLSIFRAKADIRGIAWAQSVLAMIYYLTGRLEDFREALSEAIEKRLSIADCSLEYYDFINELKVIIKNSDASLIPVNMRPSVDDEIARIEAIYSDTRTP